MTREEAIKVLEEYGTLFPFDKSEAIDMAIEALKRVSFENDTEIKSCSKDSDLISRDDAIKCVRWGWSVDNVINAISALPSAEAEWIDIDNYHRTAICSHCRKVTMFEKWGERTKPYDYCPNCGAKIVQGMRMIVTGGMNNDRTRDRSGKRIFGVGAHRH